MDVLGAIPRRQLAHAVHPDHRLRRRGDAPWGAISAPGRCSTNPFDLERLRTLSTKSDAAAASSDAREGRRDLDEQPFSAPVARAAAALSGAAADALGHRLRDHVIPADASDQGAHALGRSSPPSPGSSRTRSAWGAALASRSRVAAATERRRRGARNAASPASCGRVPGPRAAARCAARSPARRPRIAVADDSAEMRAR